VGKDRIIGRASRLDAPRVDPAMAEQDERRGRGSLLDWRYMKVLCAQPPINPDLTVGVAGLDSRRSRLQADAV
jgi:hypothetical protein